MSRVVRVCLMLTLVLWGCSHEPVNPCPNCPTTSFTADIIPIFKASCATPTCHTGPMSSAAGSLTLDSAVAYKSITEQGTGYVYTGNANYSLLYTQLPAMAPNHMPVGSQLSPCDIQKIYCWIQQGALDN